MHWPNTTLPVKERTRFDCGYDFIGQPLKIGNVVVLAIPNRNHGSYLTRAVVTAPLPQLIRVKFETAPGYYKTRKVDPARCLRIDTFFEADKIIRDLNHRNALVRLELAEVKKELEELKNDRKE